VGEIELSRNKQRPVESTQILISFGNTESSISLSSTNCDDVAVVATYNVTANAFSRSQQERCSITKGDSCHRIKQCWQTEFPIRFWQAA
jgi:hypothetical protein